LTPDLLIGDLKLMANIGLYRSTRHSMIAGVVGGIAERYNWNANLLRVIFIAVSIMSAAFPGILVYIVLWFVIPKRPAHFDNNSNNGDFRSVN
jgi:phage shock protein PspC (stress-responsive transcriptional regulator)